MANRRTPSPLLRAFTLGGALSCTPSTQATPPDDATPDGSAIETSAYADAKLLLRGVVNVPGDARRVWVQVVAADRPGPMIELPTGPGAVPFVIADPQLRGLELPEDQVRLVAAIEVGETAYREASLHVPLRTNLIQLTPTETLPPLPADAIPSPDQVEALLDALPATPDAAIDIRGVVVFDNRRAATDASMRLSIPGGHGFQVPLTGPSPAVFHIHDATPEVVPWLAWLERLTGAPPSKFLQTQELSLAVGLASGHLRVGEQATVDARTHGLVLVLQHKRTAPQPAPFTTAQLDIHGLIHKPEQVQAKNVWIRVRHALGTTEPIFLPDGPWPRPFHLTGPAWADVPVRGGEVTVEATLSTADSIGTASLTLPIQRREVVLRPELRERLAPPERPVYGNTKGSRYDTPRRTPAPPSTPGPADVDAPAPQLPEPDAP